MPPGWFESTYAADPDPWDFASSRYEHAKYADTIAALRGRRYRSAFEAGCAIGVLTVRLAAAADRLLAVDAVDAAVVQARARTTDLPHVRVDRATLPEDWPVGPFDLVVLSEIAYYFSGPVLEKLIDAAVTSLTPGGDLLAVHWTGATDYPLSGDEAHDRLLSRADLAGRHGHRAEGYRLDLLERV